MMDNDEAHGRMTLLRVLVADAVRNLHGVRQHSVLALLGIVIGTAAVIAMVTIGGTAKHQSLLQFTAMGTDLLAVRKDFMAPGAPGGLTLADVTALQSLTGVDAAAPLAVTGVDIGFGRNRMTGSVGGTGPALAEVTRLPLAAGRFLTDGDARRTVVVLGSDLARQLAGDGRPVAVGDQVRLGSYNYTVIGIGQHRTGNPLLPIDLNTVAFVPLSGLRRVSPMTEITSLVVRMHAGAADTTVADSVSGYFTSPPRPRPMTVQTARQLIEAMTEQMQVYTLLLSAIGGISLVVGGVGVMNVMLMSVAERRREIGVRLALGARPQDILVMFLSEAVMLSLAGGVIGIILGISAAAAYAHSVEWNFVTTPYAVPLGVSMSLTVGLFFGLYPAWKASLADPVAALRGE